MKPEINVIKEFLGNVDKSFPTSLSEKQNLTEFAYKLHEKATICAEYDGEKIISMVAGYTDYVYDSRAYISIVATISKAQGRGYATKLVREFIEISKEKKLDAIHLYAVKKNKVAVDMYKKIGFVEWEMPNEERKDDLHLIYYLT